MGGLMSTGFSSSSSDQESESNSGISKEYKGRVSEDAYNQSALSRDLSTQYARSPFGYFQNQDIRSLIPQNQHGLPIQTTQALGALGNSWFSKASAGGSMRGQNTPENTNQIVGSAMLNGAQFLMPHILQNQQYLAELPDRLSGMRMGFLQADQDSRSRLLGSSATGTGTGLGFGMQMGFGSGGSASSSAPVLYQG